jgi:hypothetical protein
MGALQIVVVLVVFSFSVFPPPKSALRRAFKTLLLTIVAILGGNFTEKYVSILV